MFTPPNEQDKQVSDNQTPEAKTAAEQPAAPGFAIDPAKLQREGWRALGNVFKAVGLDATSCEREVQKARLFEAIVKQHKSDIQEELGITLDVWTHRADLEQYAQNQGYLGDVSHMSRIEGELRSNVLQGPKFVLSAPAQAPITPSEERKEAAEVVQRPAEVPLGSVVEKQVAPVIDYQKILGFIEAYRAREIAKIDAGQDTAQAVLLRLAPYEKIEENVKPKAQEQQKQQAAKSHSYM